MVVFEVDTFLLATATQHQERSYRQKHTNPLPDIQTLTEDQQGTHKHHHRTSGIDRTDNRQRQVFHAEIAKNPTREDYKSFQYNIFVELPSPTCRMEDGTIKHVGRGTQDDERQEDQR